MKEPCGARVIADARECERTTPRSARARNTERASLAAAAALRLGERRGAGERLGWRWEWEALSAACSSADLGEQRDSELSYLLAVEESGSVQTAAAESGS